MMLKCTMCEITIDTNEDQVYGQMVAHMLGTHGVRVGEGDLRPHAKPVEKKQVEAKPMAKIEQPVKTFITKKGGRRIVKR